MNRFDLVPGLSAYQDVSISVEYLLKLTDGIEWKDATVGRTDESPVSDVSKNIRDASFKNLKDYIPLIDDVVMPYVEKHSEINSLDSLELEYYSLVRYTEGQFFAEHSDGGEFLPRRLSMVIYLNDDYAGGEISFTKFNTTIKPKEKTLVLFPSTEEYSHAAQPVISGTKYVLIGFWK